MPGSPEYDTPTKRIPHSAPVDIKISIPNMTLTEQIGKGGFGAVYIGEHHILKNRVAVKVLNANLADSNWTARFQREAHALSRLSHPNIVRVYSFSVLENGQAAMVMELVEGRSLHDLVNSCERLSAQRSVNICKQLCDALGYAHDLGVVHRDIKPTNIIITPDDQVKLLDFGIAKLIDEQSLADTDTKSGAQKLTSTGQFMGTPSFMSPEQCAGKPAEPSSDIYSLGCVLYFMLTGRNLFDGNTDAEVMLKHCKTTPKLKRLDVSPDLIRILAKSLKKEPKDRYTSCKLLQADLDSAVLTLKRRKDGWSRQTWGIILAGCIPIFLFGGFMAVRYSSANTNKVSVAGDELKAYNHLLKLAVADLQKGNVDAAREKLLKCIKMELPESQRYMRWRAYEYLHLVSRDKDSFKKCSEGMLSIVESKDFSHASISSDEKLQWRLRSYLCGAETGDDDAHVANFLEKAEVLLQSKTGRKLAFVEKEWLRFFSAKAGLLRSQGKFLQAAETDRKAYAFAERNLRDPVKIAEYCGKGLSNCIETKTPSNCAEPHRSMLLKLLAASRGGSAETLDLAMRTTGNDPKSLINFARQVRATAFYLSKKNNAAVEWVVLNMYRSAADLNDGSLLGLIVPSELVYLENATKMTLLETKDPTFAQYDASINLIGAIVRYKILTAGESDAIATGNSLISSFQNPAWRLKALANVDFNLAKERKLKLSLNAREAFNTRFSELLLAAATDPKTQAGFQNDDLVIEATGRMYNAMVYQGLTSQQRTEVYGRWYKVLKESPLASPVLKVRLLSLMAVGLTQSQKQEKNARTFAERCACDLLELLPLCKLYNRASVDVYANALDYISYGLNVQVSPRRLELETKIFDSFQSHDFFKSSDLKGKCLVQWLMIALYCESSSTCAIPLPEGQLDSVASMVTEHAPTVKGNDAEWALSESVRAVVGLYKGKGNTAKAVAYASKIMDIAAKNGCSKSTIENLKKQLEIAKS